MKTLFHTFAVILTLAPAALAGTMPPAHHPAEKWIEEFASKLEREHRILLATHVPSVFGLQFLCQLKQGEETKAVLPGDWVEAPSGGSLKCPDALDATLGAETRLRVSQSSRGPVFFLERGELSLQFKQNLLFLESSEFSLALLGEGKLQQVVATKKGDGLKILCKQGSLTADYRTDQDDPAQQQLAAKNCRIELALQGSAIHRYLLSGDTVQVPNLALPRKFWPPLVTAAADNTGITLAQETTKDATKGISLRWQLPFSGPEAWKCTLQFQSSDTAPATESQKFEAQAATGTIMLPPGQQDGIAYVLCDSKDATYASNPIILAPILPGKL